MTYQLISNIAKSIPLSLVARGLRDVKLSSLAILGHTYLHHEREVARQNKNGTLSPTSLNLELTSFCPYRCDGCYIPIDERRKKDIIDPRLAHSIVQEAVDMGIRVINLYGGEPLQQETIGLIEDIVRTHPTTSFFSCTNGHYLAKHAGPLDHLVDQPNYTIALSIDGFQPVNDLIRGRGSFNKLVKAADYLKSRRALFGGVITVRDENINDVLSEKFVEYLIELGLMYMAYSVSDQLTNVDNAMARMQELKKKPIFEYNGEGGSGFTSAKHNVSRAIFVKSDGNAILLRGKRDLVLGRNLADVAKDPRWQKMYH